MLYRKRACVISILLCVAAAGCTPANFVQNVRPAPKRCEVRVCLNPQTGLQRCACQTFQQTERQLREAGWLESL